MSRRRVKNHNILDDVASWAGHEGQRYLEQIKQVDLFFNDCFSVYPLFLYNIKRQDVNYISTEYRMFHEGQSSCFN